MGNSFITNALVVDFFFREVHPSILDK